MTEEEKQKSYSEENNRITETIAKINHRIAVFSGKRGVGKTTVSVNLAYALQLKGFTTDILDADVTGPNVSKMLSIYDDFIFLNQKIIPFERYGVKVIGMVWR
jgi:ATP-binding protein involved in chromosome partitioning